MTRDNKALVCKWFEEVWNERRADLIDDMMDVNCLAHGLGDTPIRGTEQFQAFHQKFCGAFQDLKVVVEEVIAEGDLTAARFTVTGTHSGDHLGIAATGKHVMIT